MKKYVGYTIIVIILLFMGCTNKNIENNIGNINSNDKTEAPSIVLDHGKYRGIGNEWEYGNEDATVIISAGKMVQVTLRRLDKSGNEVDYDEWTGEPRDGKIFPNLKQYRIDLANEMLEQQTYDVDTISGATVSCINWKLAVKRALEQAVQ